MAAVPLSTFAYRLTVLTHGQSSTLAASVGSFIANADPLPRETIIVVDGPENQAVREVADVMERARLSTRVVTDARQRGFCEATNRCWNEARKDGPDWVVHLEHDFRLLRHTNFEEIAVWMDNHPHLAQVSLMRNAVNQVEKAAGGLYESRKDQFIPCGPEGFQHRQYFTTNVSLMRREFMNEHPWPDPEIASSECEGKFGWDLVHEHNWWFGVWGNGEPWTEHIGVRDGSGFGY